MVNEGQKTMNHPTLIRRISLGFSASSSNSYFPSFCHATSFPKCQDQIWNNKTYGFADKESISNIGLIDKTNANRTFRRLEASYFYHKHKLISYFNKAEIVSDRVSFIKTKWSCVSLTIWWNHLRHLILFEMSWTNFLPGFHTPFPLM